MLCAVNLMRITMQYSLSTSKLQIEWIMFNSNRYRLYLMCVRISYNTTRNSSSSSLSQAAGVTRKLPDYNMVPWFEKNIEYYIPLTATTLQVILEYYSDSEEMLQKPYAAHRWFKSRKINTFLYHRLAQIFMIHKANHDCTTKWTCSVCERKLSEIVEESMLQIRIDGRRRHECLF